MINRIKHSINSVDFVPVNKDEITLNASFPDDFGDWENDFTTGNTVQLPKEAYLELLRHLNDTGVQQMPRYNMSIDGQNNPFFVDLYQNVRITGSIAEVTIQNYESKDNIQQLINDTTFEYLRQAGLITDADMVLIKYVVIPQDIGAKILSISSMIYTIVSQIIARTERLTTRIGDLIAGVTPSVGAGVVMPIGSLIRFGILIIMDIAILIVLTLALKNLTRQAFELLLPPVRDFRAMTIDRLLTISLAKHGITYQSSLKSEWGKATALPVPIDYKKKKFFELLLNTDDRVLNRGYPTSSDTIPTCGALIGELCKMYNIRPRMANRVLILEPKVYSQGLQKVSLDYNFNSQDKKENEMVIDLSKVWNTKILSYTNDATDKMLYDNPRGLRVEYKSLPFGVPQDDLTIIKGLSETRISFALGTIKSETKLEEFLKKLAETTDKFLNTSFTAKINKRLGVLAISPEQFTVTKLLYQTGGKQTPNYLSFIGAESLYERFHAIDDSKDSLYLQFSAMPVRMNNQQFKGILLNNLVTLEGRDVEVLNIEYAPESSTANIDYREKQASWASHIKSVKIYAE